ncbi:MAG: glycoside hydrolase family 10 [Planctomycetota bacterium]
MGQMHFDVPKSAVEFLRDCDWANAYLCGIEGVPWQTRNALKNHRLTLTRSVDTSAKLFMTCVVPEIGQRLLTTCTLRCGETPHRLLIELARGSCYRVRIQADTWQRGGLSLNDRFDALLKNGTAQFLDAVQGFRQSGPTDAVTQSAIASITTLEQAADELGQLFASQSIAFRRSRENRFSTMLAVGVRPPEPATIAHLKTASIAGSSRSSNDDPQVSMQPVLDCFNAAAVRVTWTAIETGSGRFDFEAVGKSIDACVAKSLKVIAGPLISYHESGLPSWLSLMEDDFEKLVTTMIQFVEATVTQLRGRVQLWNAASGLNTVGPLRLDDEQIMRMSIAVLQTIRRIDPNTPVIMSLDQPCGEYLSKDQNGISPLHFADALLRSGLGLAGIGLNFRFGHPDGSTFPRSSVEFAQLIDRWATLGTPLLVQLSVPGRANPHDETKHESRRLAHQLHPHLNGDSADWAEFQNQFTKPLVDTLLAKQVVHAIVWEHWSDEPEPSSAGLLDANGQPRPVLRYLSKIRDELLM